MVTPSAAKPMAPILQATLYRGLLPNSHDYHRAIIFCMLIVGELFDAG